MNNQRHELQQDSPKLKVLTAAALKTDKDAGHAKEQARLAKANLKAARKQLKEAKGAFKASKKLARKATREAKRARKALQTHVNRLAKRKKKKGRRSRSASARGMDAQP